jgi:hypothetical protein
VLPLSSSFVKHNAVHEINPVAPQIAKGPNEVDPTSTVELSGQNFGCDKGKIRMHFTSPLEGAHWPSDIKAATSQLNAAKLLRTLDQAKIKVAADQNAQTEKEFEALNLQCLAAAPELPTLNPSSAGPKTTSRGAGRRHARALKSQPSPDR